MGRLASSNRRLTGELLTASSAFFGQRNAQAVLKHGVLTRYAYYFAARAGSATGGRVAFVDGYAGEGRYRDGNPGSPLLLASEAEAAKLLGRDVKLAFVEQDDARRDQLRASLAESHVQPDQLLGGSFQEVVGPLLDRYSSRATLLFVDPFGLALDRPLLEAILGRSKARHPIDVLYHFSLSSVARMGRAGVTTGPGSKQSADQLDAALGGINWRKSFENATGSGEPTQAALEVADLFGTSVATSTGFRVTSIPVRSRPDRLPQYVLMLFSRNEEAHWDFADQAAKAHVDWLHHCSSEDYAAFVQRQEATGMISLFDPEVPDLEDLDAHLKREATSYLRANLEKVVRERGQFRPVDLMAETYGEWFGRARITHYRDAVKSLHRDGLIDDDGTNDFFERIIRWLGPS